MLSAGWQPFKATGAQACSDSDRRCTGRPEMEACAGSGMANCRFLWQMNGKTVAILTVGEEAAFSGIDTTQTPVNTASGVHGAPLGSIVDAMAIKSSASHTNNSWEETAKIMGVTWNWPYHESGAYNSTMVGITKVGSDKNPNIGATEVTINGTRSFITDIRISIRNESLV